MAGIVIKLMGGHLPERRVPRAKYVPAGRSLYLLDLENLMGGPRAGMAALRQVVSYFRDAVPREEGDHYIIGVNPRIGAIAKACWPSAKLVARAGPNGADIALIEQVKNVRFIAARYDRIVIGSGDGVFVHVAVAYRSQGLVVEVASRCRSLSPDLRSVASVVRILPELDFDLAA